VKKRIRRGPGFDKKSLKKEERRVKRISGEESYFSEEVVGKKGFAENLEKEDALNTDPDWKGEKNNSQRSIDAEKFFLLILTKMDGVSIRKKREENFGEKKRG